MAAYSTYTDQELMALLKQGDHLAFSEIYNRYSPLLYVYAFKLTADRDVTKDITQELFISLWDNREALELRISLSAYLYTSVRYKFLKQVKHQKVKADYADKFLHTFESSVNSTEDYMEERDLIKTVERLVSVLPPKMARAFILSKLEFKTHEEIAEELGISEKTVKNLLAEGIKQIRPKMGLALLSVLLLS